MPDVVLCNLAFNSAGVRAGCMYMRLSVLLSDQIIRLLSLLQSTFSLLRNSRSVPEEQTIFLYDFYDFIEEKFYRGKMSSFKAVLHCFNFTTNG